MFYCNDCARERSWPCPTIKQSRGRCEICEREKLCNELASSRIPRPRHPETNLDMQTHEAREQAMKDSDLLGSGFTYETSPGTEIALDPSKVKVYRREYGDTVEVAPAQNNQQPHVPVEIGEEGHEPSFVWVCDLCGQPLGHANATCNSGIHVGPSGQHVGVAVKSTDLAQANWDMDDNGRSNSSGAYHYLTDAIERLIRSEGGWALSRDYSTRTAALIVAQLAHQFGMKPSWWMLDGERPEVEHVPVQNQISPEELEPLEPKRKQRVLIGYAEKFRRAQGDARSNPEKFTPMMVRDADEVYSVEISTGNVSIIKHRDLGLDTVEVVAIPVDVPCINCDRLPHEHIGRHGLQCYEGQWLPKYEPKHHERVMCER